MIKVFLRALQIKSLTDCVETEFVPESLMPCPPLHVYVHSILPYIQLYLHTHHSDLYRQLSERKVHASLQLMSFYQVGRLDAVYKLTGYPGVQVRIILTT